MKREFRVLFIALALILAFVGDGFAADGDISISGKEIIVKLAKLEEGQNGLNRRIDDQGKRIDDLRSELKGDIRELGGRMDNLKNQMYVVLAGIFAVIGFVIWDRRTALSPVIRKARELEERNDLTVRVLKEYATKEPKMAEVLRSLGLL